ncbi:MAG: CBS and ACT domain-containing protein [Syntrophobacteraceae bacterium]
MFVKDWMDRKVVTVDENDTMRHAMSLMKEHEVRMLPVLKKGKLTGILSDKDLKRASASDATSLDTREMLFLISKIKVKEIMSKDPAWVPHDFTVEEAAELLLERNISSAPAMNEHGEILGIITRDNIFRVLISLTALGKKGVLFGFRAEDRPGSIKELTDIIRSRGGRIASILSTYEGVPAGFRVVYIRAYAIDRKTLKDLQAELKAKAVMLSIVDHRENRREIFHDPETASA